jgi:hypothetical protein
VKSFVLPTLALTLAACAPTVTDPAVERANAIASFGKTWTIEGKDQNGRAFKHTLEITTTPRKGETVTSATGKNGRVIKYAWGGILVDYFSDDKLEYLCLTQDGEQAGPYSAKLLIDTPENVTETFRRYVTSDALYGAFQNGSCTITKG